MFGKGGHFEKHGHLGNVDNFDFLLVLINPGKHTLEAAQDHQQPESGALLKGT